MNQQLFVVCKSCPCKACPKILSKTPVESNARTYHERFGSERPAERPGGFGQDKVPTELFVGKKKIHRTFKKASKRHRVNVSPEARPSEILCKPTEEQNHRLTRRLSALYQWDEKRFLFMAAGQRKPFYDCKSVYCKSCLEIKFPDMPSMRRVHRDEKTLFHWSAARNKERFSPR